ncbi:maturation protein [ssRNA phage Gerhypos.4_31]|uniref:Maturation protein n=2 Tax=Leviviricetes TaxID=2842243 RepID=A0A8S5L4G3_9VIRU|nr:maturation protein [ssRNA phage Gerhypos.4_31]DAD52082.1 TPA_asm: maturation protein [ssRNA phage Gerhypos.4_31]
MPFYEEWYQNDTTVNWAERLINNSLDSRGDGISNVDLVHLNTYRTRPAQGARLLQSVVMPSEKADPYTIFIDQNRAKRDAAIARGFNANLFTEDRGHPFELVRYKSEGTLWSGSFETFNGFYTDTFRGANLDLSLGGNPLFPTSFAPMEWSDLPAYAQTAYAKASPTPSMFSLSQFLGEVHEGLPRFGLQLLTRTQSLKAVGSDYLNVEFGWIPFISDLQSAGQALLGATTALLGPRGPLHRLRREAAFSDSRSASYGPSIVTPLTWVGTSSGTTESTFYPFEKGIVPKGPFGSLGNGNIRLIADKVTISELTESERWFEGSFSFIPKIGFNPDSYLDRLGQLMSTEITPSVLWELAPWSWLTDWFLKIGNTIAANEVASDNRIVSNYAYAMEQKTVTRGMLATGLHTNKYAGPANVVRRWTTTGKRRIRANPYGFKPMTTANLNTNQWLIMAALGLTNAGR